MAKTKKLHLLANPNETNTHRDSYAKAACGATALYFGTAWFIPSSPLFNDASRICPKCAVARVIAETAPSTMGA